MPFNQTNLIKAGKVAALNSVSARFLYNDDISIQGFLEDAGASMGSSYVAPVISSYLSNIGLSPEQLKLISNVAGDVVSSYAIDQVTLTREPVMEKLVKFTVSEYVVNMNLF